MLGIKVPEGYGVMVYGNNPVVVDIMRPDGEVGTISVDGLAFTDHTDEQTWPEDSIPYRILWHMATVVSGLLYEARLREDYERSRKG